MRKNLTKMTLSTKPPKSGRIVINDKDSPLEYRITGSGVRSLSVRTRLHEKQIRVTWPGAFKVDAKGDIECDIAAARSWAHDAIAKAKRGEDPRPKAAPVERAPDTFQAVVERFLEMYAKRKNRSWRETARLLGLKPDRDDETKWTAVKGGIVEKWGSRPINGIRRIDVTGLLDDIEKASGVYTANRTLAALRKLFNWHAARDDYFTSPIVKGMARLGEAERTRTLTDDEIKKLWTAWEAMPFPWGPYFQTLLLTMQRKMEVATMRRSQIDGGMWIIPASGTKAKRVQTVPLSAAVQAIVDELPKFKDRDLLFTSGRKGDEPLAGFSRAKADAERLSGVTGWRLHDLRRTGGDWLKRARFDIETRKAVLNHSARSLEGVTAVYAPDPHSMDEPKRRALEAWAAHVEQIVAGKKDEKVVQIAGAR